MYPTTRQTYWKKRNWWVTKSTISNGRRRHCTEVMILPVCMLFLVLMTDEYAGGADTVSQGRLLLPLSA